MGAQHRPACEHAVIGHCECSLSWAILVNGMWSGDFFFDHDCSRDRTRPGVTSHLRLVRCSAPAAPRHGHPGSGSYGTTSTTTPGPTCDGIFQSMGIARVPLGYSGHASNTSYQPPLRYDFFILTEGSGCQPACITQGRCSPSPRLNVLRRSAIVSLDVLTRPLTRAPPTWHSHARAPSTTSVHGAPPSSM